MFKSHYSYRHQKFPEFRFMSILGISTPNKHLRIFIYNFPRLHLGMYVISEDYMNIQRYIKILCNFQKLYVYPRFAKAQKT